MWVPNEIIFKKYDESMKKKINPFFRFYTSRVHGFCKIGHGSCYYHWNEIFAGVEGDCGLWVPNELIFKKYAESLKTIVVAVLELPAK